MTTNKHTPGPWNITNGWAVQIGTKYFVQNITEGVTIGHADGYADARLIAAAPELLEALQDALAVIEHSGIQGAGFATDKARAAIAKAKGEE